ncbi:MAG: hypothetical protein NTZ33_00715 [Bacteroidetes bacterium]|nr:hypothetical protein [Bacteroidota bacterium]
MFRNFIVLILIFILASNVFSQQKSKLKGDKSFAKELFDNQNYKTAMDEYLLLIKEDSSNVVYKHNLAICYLNLNTEKNLCIRLLEAVVMQPKTDPNALYDLALAYHRSNRFDDAIKTYQKFIELINKKDKNYIPASRQIEMCNNAKELILKPVDVSFENLGKEINSISPDIRPYVTADEAMMVFTSKRAGNIGNLFDYDGFNSSDIFICNYSDRWSKPKRLASPINTPLSEDCTGLTADGTTLCIHYDNEKMLGDMLISELKGKSFQRPLNASPSINSDADETAACLSQDKKVMFFASSRKQGYGARDLYYSRKLASGEWSEAVNLGDVINTRYDENYPYLAPDGETLYFCSVGHNSMGGYDIFKTKWDKENNSFSEAVNIGYPINTADDERSISFTRSGRYAYMDAARDDALGNRDIYRIVFYDVHQPTITIKGQLEIQDTLVRQHQAIDKQHALEGINIRIYDKNTLQLLSIHPHVDKSGKYNVTLSAGTYIFKFESELCYTFDFEMIIPDREAKQQTIIKDIKLILKTN